MQEYADGTECTKSKRTSTTIETTHTHAVLDAVYICNWDFTLTFHAIHYCSTHGPAVEVYVLERSWLPKWIDCPVIEESVKTIRCAMEPIRRCSYESSTRSPHTMYISRHRIKIHSIHTYAYTSEHNILCTLETSAVPYSFTVWFGLYYVPTPRHIGVLARRM